MTRALQATEQRFPLAKPFSIARGSKTESVVVLASIVDGEHRGHGECVPYARYGETMDSVLAQIAGVEPAIAAGCSRAELQALLPAGAARNAVDCALWDLDAKRLGIRAASLAGLHRLAPVVTAFTLSLDTPDHMEREARVAADRPLLKVKLGRPGDAERIAAVRRAAPDATLIVDANEGWTAATLADNLAACHAAGVVLVEQPLPASDDALLAEIESPVPLCADESVHTRAGLQALSARYDAINVKLDKTGGLTEALMLCDEAEALGLGLFVGCMVGTSLGMAPAMLLTPRARFVDLDGPLLLARDREPALRYEGSVIHPPEAALWG